MHRALTIGVLALAGCYDDSIPAQCSSGIEESGTSEGEDMTPGQPCNDCHAYTNAGGDGNEAPIYAFAGTVYTTAHEPDDCAGGPIDGGEGAEVEVVDADGVRFTVPITKVGNFMFESTALVYPVTARILYQGRVRWMIEPQMSGDCNTCHSADGKEGASGRIRLP